jgi:hypothetical protein
MTSSVYAPPNWIDHPLAHNHVVSHEHNFIYTYIPKAACTTLKTALLPYLNVEYDAAELTDNPDKIHNIILPKVPPSEAIHLQREKGYFGFAFIRDPYERLVSFYKSKIFSDGRTNDGWVNGIPHYLEKMYANSHPFHKDMTFEECIHNINNIRNAGLIMEEHFRSQHSFLHWPTGEQIPSFIGLFEELKKGLDHITDNLALDLQIGKLNPTKKSSLGDYYNKGLTEMVTQMYTEDIALYERIKNHE